MMEYLPLWKNGASVMKSASDEDEFAALEASGGGDWWRFVLKEVASV